MTSTITAVVDGSTCTVVLSRVTALDAMQFRIETGTELDLAVLSILERGEVVLIADLAVVRWLWVRQEVDPLAPFVTVAASITLFPAEPEPAEGVA